MPQQQWYELGKLSLSGRVAQRAIAARLPAAYQSGDFQRLAESHAAELVERLPIVCRGGKKQLLLSRLGGSCLLEQAGVVPLHAVEVGEKSLGKRIPIRKAEKACKLFQ